MTRDDWLAADDAKLLAACRVEKRAAGGPGGQKRNKTAAEVRLLHQPTGITAQAGDDRSPKVNLGHAVRQLRLKIAVSERVAVDLGELSPPEFWSEYVRNGRVKMNAKNPLFPAAVAWVLDVLDAAGGDPSAAATNVGVSLRSLLRLLRGDAIAWRAADDVRRKWSLPLLTPP
ncbi:MAG: peptide chain release factor-like protein [Planctomycetota bacterium]